MALAYQAVLSALLDGVSFRQDLMSQLLVVDLILRLFLLLYVPHHHAHVIAIVHAAIPAATKQIGKRTCNADRWNVACMTNMAGEARA